MPDICIHIIGTSSRRREELIDTSESWICSESADVLEVFRML
jgi:hypothetical protein